MEKKSDKKIIVEFDIPENIRISLEGDELVMRKENTELRRKLNPLIGLKIEGNKIIIKSRENNKKGKKIFGTIKAHIKNMIEGFREKYRYKVQVVSVHFPMTVTHDKEKNEIIVKNFLGEKKERRIKVLPGVDIKINKDIIEIESADVEKAGQTAANIEKGTRVRNRDRRIYQDGIFIIEKPGRSFL